MNENKGIRLWQWAVLLLVLCNIGLIVTMWLKPHRGVPPLGEAPRDMVIHDLKFTDDQAKKYDVLIQEHQQDMKKLSRDAFEYRQQLFANLKNGNAGNNIADSLAQLIASNQKAIEMVTYNHFAKVRALCTDEQKQEFDKIIGEVTKKMNGGPGGHCPPPGDGNPPPDVSPPPPGDQQGPPPPPDGH